MADEDSVTLNIRALRATLKTNINEVKDWLLIWTSRKECPVVSLFSIDPNSGDTRWVVDVKPDGIEEALKLVSKLNERGLNIYFLPNVMKPGLSKKPEDADIILVRASSLDYDLPEGTDFSNEDTVERLTRAKLQELLDSDLVPTDIIFTGNGLQAFWFTEHSHVTEKDSPAGAFAYSHGAKHTPQAQELGRKIGRHLKGMFHGDKTIDPGRIMRLPGTINWPNDTKAKLGKVACVSKILSHDPENILTFGDLMDLEARAPQKEEKEEERIAISKTEVDALVKEWETDTTVQKLPAWLEKLPNPNTDKPKWVKAKWAEILIWELCRGTLTNEDQSGSQFDYSFADVLRKKGLTWLQACYFVQNYGGESSTLYNKTKSGRRNIIKGKIRQFARAWITSRTIEEKEKAKQAELEAELLDIQQSYCFLSAPNHYKDLKTGSSHTGEVLNTLHKKLANDCGLEKFLDGYKEVEVKKAFSVTIAPVPEGQEIPMFVEGAVSNNTKETFLNLWHINQFTVKPKEGTSEEIALIGRFWEIFIPNKEERDITLDQLAYIHQEPGKKPVTALLIVGETGTGKSTITGVLRGIFGAYFRTIDSDVIKQQYNDFLEESLVIVIEEIEMFTQEKRDVANRLKSWITDPEGNIRGMYSRGRNGLYLPSFVAFSNADAPIWLNENDRRWKIVTSCSSKEMEDFNFKGLNKIGMDVWFDFFLKRDLKARAFDPYARAPETEGKEKIVEVLRQPWESCLWNWKRGLISILNTRSGLTIMEVHGEILSEGIEPPKNKNLLAMWLQKHDDREKYWMNNYGNGSNAFIRKDRKSVYQELDEENKRLPASDFMRVRDQEDSVRKVTTAQQERMEDEIAAKAARERGQVLHLPKTEKKS